MVPDCQRRIQAAYSDLKSLTVCPTLLLLHTYSCIKRVCENEDTTSFFPPKFCYFVFRPKTGVVLQRVNSTKQHRRFSMRIKIWTIHRNTVTLSRHIYSNRIMCMLARKLIHREH